MKCTECGHDFCLGPLDEPERDVCHTCEARAVQEAAPELFHDDDWCNECNAPIGMGSCDGCCAVACCDSFDEADIETTCDHCGKDIYDFSDLGCGYCDARHPGFGVTP